MQQPRSSISAKRARVEQSNVREDCEGDSIDVDCDIFSVTSPERDLADETTRHTPATSAAAPSNGGHDMDGNILARSMNGLDSTVITAREALSALDPVEEVTGPLQEGAQLSQKKIGPDFTTDPHRVSAPAECSTHDNYRTSATSWNPSHSNPISSVRPAATVVGLDQAALPNPQANPNTNRSDNTSSSIRRITNRDVMNTSLNPVNNFGPPISSMPDEAENSLHSSNSISRIMNPSLENTTETNQAERRYYSLTAQISAQVSQNLRPPNHQPPFANEVQSRSSNQSGEEVTSSGDSGIISEDEYSPTPSQNSGSSNCSDRDEDTPQGAGYPRNLTQNDDDNQLPFESRFSRSNMNETIAQHPPPPPPPPRRTDQDRDPE